MDEALHQLVHQQEVVIHVLRERVMELEMELVNARCAAMFDGHTHGEEGEDAVVHPVADEQPVPTD